MYNADVNVILMVENVFLIKSRILIYVDVIAKISFT